MRKKLFYLFLALNIIYYMLPNNSIIKNKINEHTASNIVNLELNFYPNANYDYIPNSINDVVDKVEHSKNITNKDEVISRLKNVNVKVHRNIYVFRNINSRMFYYYNRIIDKDYIIIKNGSYNLHFKHELNHLVYQHKIDSITISESDLVIEPELQIYLDFFKDYPLINKKEFDSLYTISGFVSPDEDNFSLGNIYYSIVMYKKSYHLSDDEIYARLSSFKSFLLKVKILKDINEKITKDHIVMFSKYFIQILLENNTQQIILINEQIDFFEILPILNLNKLNEINLIAQNKYKILNLA